MEWKNSQREIGAPTSSSSRLSYLAWPTQPHQSILLLRWQGDPTKRKEMQTVSNLLPFAKKLISVKSSATIKEIQTVMIANDVSYVPLIDHEGKVNVGVVRRKTIWSWMLKNDGIPPSEVTPVRGRPLPSVKAGDSLSSAMKMLKTGSALLLQGEDTVFTHFISPRVTANALESYSRKFFAIEELEGLIREKLKYLSNENHAEIADASPTDAEYTFGYYHRVFSKFWSKLGLDQFERKRVLCLILDAGKYRNSVMHFQLDEASSGLDSVQKLQKIFTPNSLKA
jgi:hypothetical protein